MRKSKLESILLYVGFAFMAGALFRQALRLPAWSEIVLSGAALVSLLALFVLRRKSRALASERPATKQSQPLALRLFSLFLIVAVSLSGPWWLPYTGVRRDFPYLVAGAIISCVFCVSLYLAVWWHATRKT